MITYADVERLLAVRVPAARTDERAAGQPDHDEAQRSVLSLYLRVPADPAELRELPARAHGLLTLAANGPDGAGGPDGHRAIDWAAADEHEARRLLDAHGRDWLGQTAAIFVFGEDGGRSEAFSLPCELPDRAVLAQRPHIRPLLVALQRCPAHLVAVVDTRHAWLFRVTAEHIETVGGTEEAGQVRSRGYAGWYGLESHRINDRVIELAHDHFRATVALLERVTQPGGQEPIVIGGHAQTIGQFAGMLPGGMRDRVAGTFAVDPHTMTPAMVRDLARPIIDDWVAKREQWLAVQTRLGEGPYDPLIVTGLLRCLDAVNQRAVQELVVPVGGIVGGYVCARCGVLSSAGTDCPDGPEHSRWVPDLFEEMVTRTIDDGGRVEALADPPGEVAAHLRFPVTEVNGR